MDGWKSGYRSIWRIIENVSRRTGERTLSMPRRSPRRMSAHCSPEFVARQGPCRWPVSVRSPHLRLDSPPLGPRFGNRVLMLRLVEGRPRKRHVGALLTRVRSATRALPMAGFGTVTAPQARQSPIGSTLRKSGVDATSGRGASTQAAMVPRPNQHRRPRGSLVCLRNDRSTPATRERRPDPIDRLTRQQRRRQGAM